MKTLPAEITSVPDPCGSVDPLGETLHYLRMNSVFVARSELTAPWAIALPAMPECLIFHIVTSGRCWLEDDESGKQLLEPGIFTLIPHGEGHILASEPGLPPTPLFDVPRKLVSERYEIVRYGNGRSDTQMICGAVSLDHPVARHLVKLLPRRLVTDSWHAPQASWIRSALKLMELEARELHPGGETIITRLADILVIQAIRTWIAKDAAARTGWLGALQDPHMGRALMLIHQAHEKRWTVASLAQAVAMSRSAFAARFKESVGETPMQYVTRWKMHLAASWLQEGDAGLSDLAERLGYQSEAAFSRAFKRLMGVSPGALRKKV